MSAGRVFLSHKPEAQPVPVSGVFEYGPACECSVKLVRFDGAIAVCQFCSRIIMIAVGENSGYLTPTGVKIAPRSPSRSENVNIPGRNA